MCSYILHQGLIYFISEVALHYINLIPLILLIVVEDNFLFFITFGAVLFSPYTFVSAIMLFQTLINALNLVVISSSLPFWQFDINVVLLFIIVQSR